ncbi:MAG: hypothetical protein GWO08_11010, partial [Gammaproteobacteria bacterium]|nr:hypothetical protein [Phycisphaerae bacterium]NIQ10336.1 hypothetical protein [Gammaproteobacteria bacterium]NIR94168.1 hypothetical protein [Gammaproteobacteria bacterium]NIW45838.1 hypothetical protein [Gammaproteobacteria bacterium]NIX01604.1 hypothetical protein [Phycisphaerae bacterium]
MADIFFTGGLNERDDLNIPVEECIEGQNFRLDSQAKTFRPRLPFDQVGLATAGGVVTGIMQLIKRDDSDTLIVAAGATMYSVDDNYAFTSAGSVATDSGFLSSYWSLDEKLVITDIKLNNVIHEWDGSTFQKCGHGIGEGVVNSASGITRSGTTATCTVTAHGYSNGDMVTIAGTTETEYNGEFIISNVSADTFDYTVSGSPSTPASGAPTAERSVDLYAKYGVVFNNRVWLFNIKEVNNATSTTSLNPHMILVSEFEEYNKFDITQRAGTATDQGYTGNEAFFLLSPDLKPINGAINFFDTLVFSTTDGQLFNFTGTDASNYSIDPFYHGSAATGTRTMVNIGNDAIYMKRGGRLDTLSATERFGDVQADDISRFIPDQTSGLSDG